MTNKTLPTKVSKAEAKRLMAEIVAEAGEDYVFFGPSWYFEVDGEPCCIIGRFFAKLGIERGDLPRTQGRPINTSLVIDDMLPDTDKEVRQALKYAQKYQDNRYPYSHVLFRLNERLDER